MNEQPYTRAELSTLKGADPQRGLYCPHCGLLIPQFADLSPADERRVRELLCAGRLMMAAAELQYATGCPASWAELWVNHRGRPQVIYGETPCPYCGKPLRTSRARQCPHCRRDWHDPNQLRWLGGRSEETDSE